MLQRGGYLTIDRRLYTSGLSKHRMAPSQAALDGLNALQGTAWRINKRALDFVEWLVATNASLSPLVEPEPLIRMSTLEWSMLSPIERRAHHEARQQRKAQKSVVRAVGARLKLAQELRDEPAFYQPHFMDFRGRMYPMNSELNNQADHWAKGLMEFAEGAELGADGLRWLMIHCANCFGHDKMSLAEREAWTLRMKDGIRWAGLSYPRMADLVSNADDPLPAAAACWELCSAWDLDDPTTYVSHLPVAIDGTCNGLQLLSLLGHDAVGAQKTNCTSDPVRQDIYMEVADEAFLLVTADLTSDVVVDTVDAEGNDIQIGIDALAAVWHSKLAEPKFRRAAVKRAIMTTAYGVSNHTIATNLVADGHVGALERPEWMDHVDSSRATFLLAGYFRDKILEARQGTITSAMQIMQYLAGVAKALGEAELPLRWTTPDGLVVTQEYVGLEDVRYLSPVLGRLHYQVPTDKIDARKCSSGAAPQVVHSLDAAMLRMVAVRLAERGITSMSMIHDSYGVHAAHTELLGTIIREVAVELFAGDWLRDSFHAEQAVHGVDLPQPPAQGTLDVAAEIPASTYFFS